MFFIHAIDKKVFLSSSFVFEVLKLVKFVKCLDFVLIQLLLIYVKKPMFSVHVGFCRVIFVVLTLFKSKVVCIGSLCHSITGCFTSDTEV